MSPLNVIVWSCVTIFIITALLTLLHISGIRTLPNPDHGKILFRALVIEVVVIALAAFSSNLVPDTGEELGTLAGSMGKAPDQVQTIKAPQEVLPLDEDHEEPVDEQEDLDEYNAALQVSEKIIDLLGQEKYEQVWDSYMSPFFKSSMNKQSYTTHLTQGRQSLGPRRVKNLIDSQYSAGDYASGYQGSVYAFTYQNTYENAALYERVVVINQDGKGFKLSGFWTDLVP